MRAIAPILMVLAMIPAGTAWAFWDPVTDQCKPPALEGVATAIDGDTLLLISTDDRKTVLRLVGIESPELHQECRAEGGIWACGYAARDVLDGLIADTGLSCLPCGYARDGARLALCRGGERDIGAEVLRAGMATSFAFFSNAMRTAQAQAESAGRGLWQGDWVHPQVWRQGVRLGEGPCRGCYMPP